MENVILVVESNVQISKDIYLMKLVGNTKNIKNSGEFIEIKLDNFYLRRPISVCKFDENSVEILYKILGHGTHDMATWKRGKNVDVIVGLGKGFNSKISAEPLLIAGGIGIAPMFQLAKEFNQNGIKPTIIYGASKPSDLVLLDELKSLGNLYICTDDGSVGYKGNVVQFLKDNPIKFDKYYACGPQIMLQKLAEFNDNGYLSLEARMGCGFGACMGCTIKTKIGPKRVCKEGPVFEASEVIFE